MNRLPKCDPEDIDPYTAQQLITVLRERVQHLQDNIGEAKTEIICNQDGLSHVKDSHDETETFITNLVEEQPSYAGVSSRNRRSRGGERNNSSQRELRCRQDTRSETEDEPLVSQQTTASER